MSIFVLVVAIAFGACFLHTFSVALWHQLRWRTWLRNVPGPPRSSFWYGNMYELIERDIVPVFLKWTAKYGRVVRIWGTFGVSALLSLI